MSNVLSVSDATFDQEVIQSVVQGGAGSSLNHQGYGSGCGIKYTLCKQQIRFCNTDSVPNTN